MSSSRCKDQVAALATRQHGRIAAVQLHDCGLTSSDIRHWCVRGDLIRVLPRTYAVGYLAPDPKAELWAAVLYAGPRAAVSHASAAHLRGLIDYRPQLIEVSTPRAVHSLPGLIRVHGRTNRAREVVDGLPVSTIPDMIVDLAATGTPRLLRRALAQLDFRHQLTAELIAAIDASCVNGRTGSQLARRMLTRHRPQHAYCRSDLEVLFIDLCVKWRLPLPRCNVKLGEITVDAYWPQFGLVVEIDGAGNHSTTAQRDADNTNDLTLRRRGLAVLRYSRRQLARETKLIRAELTTKMSPASP